MAHKIAPRPALGLAIAAIISAPALAQDLPGDHPPGALEGLPADMGKMPESIEDVRDPRGPVTPEELGTGDIEVEGEPVHDNPFRVFGMVDRLEYQSNEGDPKYVWDAFGYAGGDYNRLWIESEGEGLFDGRVEAAETQVLYNRAITPYWNAQAGVRYDVRPNPSRWYGVVALEGLNVYWSMIEADLYVSEEGDVSAKVEVEFNEFITQRLVLQPRAEVSLQAQDVDAYGLGAGVTAYEVGLRLRYEITREFAPYIGVSWAQKVGETANRLPPGEDAGALSFVAGLRMWF